MFEMKIDVTKPTNKIKQKTANKKKGILEIIVFF